MVMPLPLRLVLGALAWFPASSYRPQASQSLVATSNYDHPAWLSSCETIYLDVGTNIGVQIRKLFEPHKYPEAQVRGSFDRIFGPAAGRSGHVCALGMEPNPDQQSRLKSLETAYNSRGFRTHIYPYAAWKEESSMGFDSEKDQKHEEWNAHLSSTNTSQGAAHKVRAVDLADFILSLPKGRLKLMKLDIEGAEYETLAHALPLHVMCSNVVPEAYMEAHAWGGVETWQDERTHAAIKRRIDGHQCPEGSAPTTLMEMDDETYLHDVDEDFAGAQKA